MDRKSMSLWTTLLDFLSVVNTRMRAAPLTPASAASIADLEGAYGFGCWHRHTDGVGWLHFVLDPSSERAEVTKRIFFSRGICYAVVDLSVVTQFSLSELNSLCSRVSRPCR